MVEKQKTALALFLKEHDSIFQGIDELKRIELKNEIRIGFMHGLKMEDVELYVKKGFDALQMQVIRVALEEGVKREYVSTNIAVHGKTSEQMIQSKIEYYLQGITTSSTIEETYLKSLEMNMEKLSERIENDRTFFNQIMEERKRETDKALEDKDRLNEELRYEQQKNEQLIKEISELKDNQDVFMATHEDVKQNKEEHFFNSAQIKSKRAGISNRMIDFMNNRRRKRNTWLTSILCNDKFTVEHINILNAAYNFNVDKDTIMQVADSNMSPIKMQNVFKIMAPDFPDVINNNVVISNDSIVDESMISDDNTRNNESQCSGFIHETETPEVAQEQDLIDIEQEEGGDEYDDPYADIIDEEMEE